MDTRLSHALAALAGAAVALLAAEIVAVDPEPHDHARCATLEARAAKRAERARGRRADDDEAAAPGSPSSQPPAAPE